MASSSSSREFVNEFPDYAAAGQPQLVDPETQGRLCEPFYSQILSGVERLTRVLSSGVERIESLERAGHTSGDASVYTGTAGVALTYLRLYEVLGERRYLDTSVRLATHSLGTPPRRRHHSFIAGDSGPLVVAAIVFSRHEGSRAQVPGLVTRYLQLCEEVCGAQTSEDEVLFGRAGYLLGLLYLRANLPPGVREEVSDACVARVAEAILRSGEAMMAACHPPPPDLPPIMYKWHDKVYLGAAHGISGILYVLLHCLHVTPSHLRDKVRPTLDYLLSLQMPSANLPSSLGSDAADRLVHWCHGASGFLPTLLAAHREWGGGDTRYLSAARKCGDLIWRRGLLKKGYGLCHGVAGNAYAFLSLYGVTGESRDLYRAVRFAVWCCEYESHDPVCRTPDRPYSLYEGVAGTVHFLVDMLWPGGARLPGYGL